MPTGSFAATIPGLARLRQNRSRKPRAIIPNFNANIIAYPIYMDIDLANCKLFGIL